MSPCNIPCEACDMNCTPAHNLCAHITDEHEGPPHTNSGQYCLGRKIGRKCFYSETMLIQLLIILSTLAAVQSNPQVGNVPL